MNQKDQPVVSRQHSMHETQDEVGASEDEGDSTLDPEPEDHRGPSRQDELLTSLVQMSAESC